jgi:hypothetical protein
LNLRGKGQPGDIKEIFPVLVAFELVEVGALQGQGLAGCVKPGSVREQVIGEQSLFLLKG